MIPIDDDDEIDSFTSHCSLEQLAEMEVRLGGICKARLSNGIVEGKFAEWVAIANLSADRPADPAETAAASERAVAQSDDFLQYREAFVTAANTLIADGRCTASEIEEMGGWVKSFNERTRPIYFTYCGGMTTANRLYLNAETCEIFK